MGIRVHTSHGLYTPEAVQTLFALVNMWERKVVM